MPCTHQGRPQPGQAGGAGAGRQGQSCCPRGPFLCPQDSLGCRLVFLLMQYCVAANYYWLLVEGVYLHTLLALSVFSERRIFRLYLSIGWGKASPFPHPPDPGPSAAKGRAPREPLLGAGLTAQGAVRTLRGLRLPSFLSVSLAPRKQRPPLRRTPPHAVGSPAPSWVGRYSSDPAGILGLGAGRQGRG